MFCGCVCGVLAVSCEVSMVGFGFAAAFVGGGCGGFWVCLVAVICVVWMC